MDKTISSNFFKVLFGKFQQRRDELSHCIDKTLVAEIDEEDRIERVYDLFKEIAVEETAMNAANSYYQRLLNLQAAGYEGPQQKPEKEKP